MTDESKQVLIAKISELKENKKKKQLELGTLEKDIEDLQYDKDILSVEILAIENDITKIQMDIG